MHIVLAHVLPKFEAISGDLHLTAMRRGVRGASVRVWQIACGVSGHDYLRHASRDRIFLRCATCGRETPGWHIDVAIGRGARSRARRLSALVAVLVSVSLTGGLAQARTSGQGVDIPKEATALEGRPTVRIDVTKGGATRRELAADEAARHRLRIRIEKGQYFWVDRGNEPLTPRSAGAFTYLSSPEPGRYIRFTHLNDTIEYVEHVDMPFGSVTYWGELRIAIGK
jgi:hypothetical protein